MSDELATLETQRSKLLEELDDLRPGSITVVIRRMWSGLRCRSRRQSGPFSSKRFFQM
jgi:hypothetical protein